MQAIRTIVWVVIAIMLTIFAVANSQPVSVRVWPGYVAELPLSILVIFVFVLGFLPPFLLSLGNRWRLGRRINQQELTIAQLQSAPTLAPVAVAPVAPAAQPLAASTPDTLL